MIIFPGCEADTIAAKETVLKDVGQYKNKSHDEDEEVLRTDHST